MIVSMNNNINPSVNPFKNKGFTSFCANKEYIDLKNNFGDDLLTSNYFRNGDFYDCQAPEFKNIEDVFKLLLNRNQKNKVLIAGVGKAQEPFSYLAVIKGLSKGKPLKDIIDLNCVDIQPQINNDDLEKYSYYDFDGEPKFVKESFDYVEKSPLGENRHYKVKADLVDYLKTVFNNPQKTKWDTGIEEFSKACPSQTYDMISCNNTLLYLNSNEEKVKTIFNFSRMLKEGGILKTDQYGNGYLPFNDEQKLAFERIQKILNGLKKLAPGIWQKLK